MIVPDCLKKTKIENLLILTSGTEQISSVEALGSERMKSVIKELNSIADIVIIDCPPALMFSDAFLIGKLVNGVIIVSRVGRTRTEMLKRVVDDLRMAGINLLGVIIQQRKTSDKHGYQVLSVLLRIGEGSEERIRSYTDSKKNRGLGSQT